MGPVFRAEGRAALGPVSTPRRERWSMQKELLARRLVCVLEGGKFNREVDRIARSPWWVVGARRILGEPHLGPGRPCALESLPRRGGDPAAGDRAAHPGLTGPAEDRRRRGGTPPPADRLLHPARGDDLRRPAPGDDDSGRLSASNDADRLASKAAATAGREGKGPDRIGGWLPPGSPSIDWSVPSPARQPVPAHPSEAEHAWKDGGSWRRGVGDQAIGEASRLTCFGRAGDRTGVRGGCTPSWKAPVV